MIFERKVARPPRLSGIGGFVAGGRSPAACGGGPGATGCLATRDGLCASLGPHDRRRFKRPSAFPKVLLHTLRDPGHLSVAHAIRAVMVMVVSVRSGAGKS